MFPISTIIFTYQKNIFGSGLKWLCTFIKRLVEAKQFDDIA